MQKKCFHRFYLVILFKRCDPPLHCKPTIKILNQCIPIADSINITRQNISVYRVEVMLHKVGVTKYAHMFYKCTYYLGSH